MNRIISWLEFSLGFNQNLSEVHPAVDDEAPRSARRGNPTERVAGSVDAHCRSPEIGMVQDVDRIHTKFEFRTLIDLEPLHHIHIEADTSWSSDRGKAKRSNL